MTKEEKKIYMKEYRAKNKERLSKQRKEYYLKNIRSLKLRLINDKTNRIVGDITDTAARKPLKAYLNDIPLDITVVIKDQD